MALREWLVRKLLTKGPMRGVQFFSLPSDDGKGGIYFGVGFTDRSKPFVTVLMDHQPALDLGDKIIDDAFGGHKQREEQEREVARLQSDAGINEEVIKPEDFVRESDFSFDDAADEAGMGDDEEGMKMDRRWTP